MTYEELTDAGFANFNLPHQNEIYEDSPQDGKGSIRLMIDRKGDIVEITWKGMSDVISVKEVREKIAIYQRFRKLS